MNGDLILTICEERSTPTLRSKALGRRLRLALHPDPAAEVGAKNDACHGQHIGRTNHASPPGPLCPPPLQPQDPFPQLRHFESKFDHSGQERGQPGLQSHPSRHWLELPGRFQAVHWPNGQCGTWCVVWISSNTLLRSGQSFLLFSHNHLR